MDAFFDESMSIKGEDYFLVVVAVTTPNRRAVALEVKRLKQRPNLKARSEFKASASPPQIKKRLIQRLARDPDISICSVIWHGTRKSIQDTEVLYQRLVARCALHVVRQNPHVDLHIDKRYTNKRRQRELEAAIRERIALVPRNVVRVFQEDSSVVKELTAPDFVAWAYTQRYCHSNDAYYNIIRAKAKSFEDLSE